MLCGYVKATRNSGSLARDTNSIAYARRLVVTTRFVWSPTSTGLINRCAVDRSTAPLDAGAINHRTESPTATLTIVSPDSKARSHTNNGAHANVGSVRSPYTKRSIPSVPTTDAATTAAGHNTNSKTNND